LAADERMNGFLLRNAEPQLGQWVLLNLAEQVLGVPPSSAINPNIHESNYPFP
jgi:hypothetical protein